MALHSVSGLSIQSIMTRVAIVPSALSPYTLLTYMFTQANLGHLAVNMCFLAVFGAGVEDAVGAVATTAIYLVCGLSGGALQYMVVTQFVPPSLWSSPIAGASASCAGIVGVYAARYYRARVSFALTSVRPHVVTAVGVFLLYQLGAAVLSLVRNDQQAAAAFWAHIGGFAVGMILATLMKLPQAAEREYRRQDAFRALECGRPGEALTRWATVLANEPQNLQAILETARCWVALGDKERAGEMYTRLLQLHLQDGNRNAAASIALELHRDHVAHSSISAETILTVASALEQKGEYMLAHLYFAEAADAPDCQSKDAALLSAATLCAKKLDNPNSAIDYLNRLQQEFPNSRWRLQADDLLNVLLSGPR